MQRLFPAPAAEVAADALYADVAWPEPLAARPYVALNMVSTLDGRAAVDGRAAGIGSSTDRALLLRLRSHADAVLVGAGTLRAEDVTPTVPAGLMANRVARGLAPQPLGLIVSRSGRLPLDRSYFQRHDFARILVTTAGGAARLDSVARAQLRVLVHGERHVDLPAALRALRQDLGVRWLLCEGGPTLNHALLTAGLVDELFLTLAPKLAGGTGPTIVAGPPLADAASVTSRLVALHVEAGEVYLRYRLAPHST